MISRIARLTLIATLISEITTIGTRRPKGPIGNLVDAAKSKLSVLKGKSCSYKPMAPTTQNSNSESNKYVADWLTNPHNFFQSTEEAPLNKFETEQSIHKATPHAHTSLVEPQIPENLPTKEQVNFYLLQSTDSPDVRLLLIWPHLLEGNQDFEGSRDTVEYIVTQDEVQGIWIKPDPFKISEIQQILELFKRDQKTEGDVERVSCLLEGYLEDETNYTSRKFTMGINKLRLPLNNIPQENLNNPSFIIKSNSINFGTLESRNSFKIAIIQDVFYGEKVKEEIAEEEVYITKVKQVLIDNFNASKVKKLKVLFIFDWDSSFRNFLLQNSEDAETDRHNEQENGLSPYEDTNSKFIVD